MMNGNLRNVDPKRFAAEDKLSAQHGAKIRKNIYKKLTGRTSNDHSYIKASAKKRKNDLIDILKGKDADMRLCFMNKSYSPLIEQPVWDQHGVTHVYTNKRIIIFLAFQDFAPLLRDDLTESDRLAEQYQLAVTLFHELLVGETSLGLKKVTLTCLPACLLQCAHVLHATRPPFR